MRRWAPGAVLPGEVALAHRFGVAVGMVRRALAGLVAEGLLARRPRAGTVVTGHSPKHSLRFFFRYFRLHGVDGSLKRSRALPLALAESPADAEAGGGQRAADDPARLDRDASLRERGELRREAPRPDAGPAIESMQSVACKRRKETRIDPPSRGCSAGTRTARLGAEPARRDSSVDGRGMPLTVRHIMASGALPPGFPPVRIDGELYWDGRNPSNTPVEAVVDDNHRRSTLIFAVHIRNPAGPEPESIWQVMGRGRTSSIRAARPHIRRQKQIRRLRHIIAELAAKLPEYERDVPATREMASHGWLTQMHVVRRRARGRQRKHGRAQQDAALAVDARAKDGNREARLRHPGVAALTASPIVAGETP